MIIWVETGLFEDEKGFFDAYILFHERGDENNIYRGGITISYIPGLHCGFSSPVAAMNGSNM